MQKGDEYIPVLIQTMTTEVYFCQNPIKTNLLFVYFIVYKLLFDF